MGGCDMEIQKARRECFRTMSRHHRNLSMPLTRGTHDDFDILPQGSEELHQAFDRKRSRRVKRFFSKPFVCLKTQPRCRYPFGSKGFSFVIIPSVHARYRRPRIGSSLRNIVHRNPVNGGK